MLELDLPGHVIPNQIILSAIGSGCRWLIMISCGCCLFAASSAMMYSSQEQHIAGNVSAAVGHHCSERLSGCSSFAHQHFTKYM
jgi:uncharacterized Fe-S cluster-containing MiaB family protein